MRRELRRWLDSLGTRLGRFFTMGALEPVVGSEDRRPEVLAEVERGIAGGSSKRFSPEVEGGFQRVLEEAHFAMFFRISAVGIVFYDAFLFIDQLIIPDMMWLAAPLHLGLTTPVAVCVLVAIRRFGSRSHALASVTVGLMLATTLILFAMSRAPHAVAAAEAFSIIIVVCNIGVATPFNWALGITAGGNTAITAAILLHPTLDLPAKVFAVAINGSSSLFSLVGNYRLQTSVRRAYLLTLRESLRADDLAVSNLELRDLVDVDGLTGVANRRRFDQSLERLWRNPDGRGVALAMIDVDHFKSFNDRFGHQAGDDALRLVARTLAGVCPAGAVLARYGGEEFVLLIEGVDAEGAAAAAEEMRRAVAALAACFGPGAVPVPLTLSIGVAAVVPGPEGGSSDLVAAADAALYAAKQRGRNRVEMTGSTVMRALAGADRPPSRRLTA